MLVSSTPLVTALLASLFYKEERMNGKQLLGSLVAFAGMARDKYNLPPGILHHADRLFRTFREDYLDGCAWNRAADSRNEQGCQIG